MESADIDVLAQLPEAEEQVRFDMHNARARLARLVWEKHKRRPVPGSLVVADTEVFEEL